MSINHNTKHFYIRKIRSKNLSNVPHTHTHCSFPGFSSRKTPSGHPQIFTHQIDAYKKFTCAKYMQISRRQTRDALIRLVRKIQRKIPGNFVGRLSSETTSNVTPRTEVLWRIVALLFVCRYGF